MGWKVPIDTDVTSHYGFSAFEEAVWSYILVRCRREPITLPIRAGNKVYQVGLEKGQMIFNVSHYAKEMACSRRRIEIAIHVIHQSAYKLCIERKPYGLIIKPLNLDQILKMSIERNLSANSPQIEMKTIYRNKNVREREGEEEPHTLTEDENVLEEVNLKASHTLKKEMGLLEWFDKQNEIEYSLKISELSIRIGKNELIKRFRDLLAQPFHRERFNEIKYVYERLVSYIPN